MPGGPRRGGQLRPSRPGADHGRRRGGAGRGGPSPGARLSGLVLNERGLERALAAGVDEINVVVLVTETFSRHNQGMGVEEALRMWSRVAAGAAGGRIGATVTLSAAFGCPYEGWVDPARVRETARRVADDGPVEIALADTIGCAVPPEVDALVGGVAADTGLPVRVHLHNSRNTGYANALAAIAAGASTLDASIGGIGGCPFAPGATGNIATEDLVHLLDRMDIPTGVSLDKLLATSRWLEGVVGHPVPGQLGRSGPFPPPATDPSEPTGYRRCAARNHRQELEPCPSSTPVTTSPIRSSPTPRGASRTTSTAYDPATDAGCSPGSASGPTRGRWTSGCRCGSRAGGSPSTGPQGRAARDGRHAARGGRRPLRAGRGHTALAPLADVDADGPRLCTLRTAATRPVHLPLDLALRSV